MRRARLAVMTITGMVAALVLNAPVQAAPAGEPQPGTMDVYVGEIQTGQLPEFVKAGVAREDVSTKGTANPDKIKVEAILTIKQAKTLKARGLSLNVKTIKGIPASKALRQKALAGHTVYRSYSQAGGIKDELIRTARDNPGITKLVNIGKTHQGKDIYALKVSSMARWLPDGLKPSTLYAGGQHAREWITPEMTRRLMHHVIAGYGKDAQLTKLINTTELWFLPVINPDGYDHTFTPDNRLWRKNLRDNDGDGQITTADGVDPNRNYATKWAFDDEGSSPDPANDTYRGPGPNSEPESKALDGLFKKLRPKFFINYHSAAELLLYGVGWQVSTPLPDDEIAVALAGTDSNSAIPGYDPDISAELYTTNGDTDTHMQVKYGSIGFTPEMTTCETVSDSIPDDEWFAEDCESGFNFPDDEELIQAEFAKNSPFALSLAKSAWDPANPKTVTGLSTPDFAVDKFDTSFGGTQQVAAIARKSLLAVRMHFAINGGAPKTARVDEWKGGERYGDTHTEYFAEYRGKVTGAKAGDSVKVWFSGLKLGAGFVNSESFTYKVHNDIGGDGLILAAEDTTGLSPVQNLPSAQYADEVAASLTAAGFSSDVYDFDLQGRKAPHHLGVLSHYRAVVWETGEDIITRSPGQVPGTTTRSALEIELNVRDYLNEGGKLLVSGKYALFAQAANGAYNYNPDAPPECTTPGDYPCLTLGDDFLQYWLGAYVYVSGAGSTATGTYPLDGNAGQFAGFDAQLDDSQDNTSSFLATSTFLPQFPGSATVDWNRPGAAPFDPHTGSWYLYSGRNDESFKRMTRTVDLTSAATGSLNFWTSYDVEADWDYLFVEAHEVGTDTWTTLPEANGHTQTGTGESCLSGNGWRELHPQLNHYQGLDCSPTGTTGTWNAATGSSGGWQEWTVDLSAYAGKQVEISISYASDWGTQGLGVFIDDTTVTVGGSTSFEDGLGGWTVGTAPGSAATATFTRSQTAFDEGAVVVTADTVYTGFGLEGLTPAARADFVARAMRHLLGS